MAAEASVANAGTNALPRLELRVERLNLTFRLTFAFHAREVRFERADGEGPFERIFPETFSFHVNKHDPTELFLQLDDLLAKTHLLGMKAKPRDARNLMTRLLSSAPRYLDRLCAHLDTPAAQGGSASHKLSGKADKKEGAAPQRSGRLSPEARLRFHQDIALLCQILLRFLESHELESGRELRVASYALKRRIHQSLRVLVDERVDPDYLEAYVRGAGSQLVDPSPMIQPSRAFFQVLETGRASEAADRMTLRMAERAFYLWLEGVCLDEENQAFEKEDSPFGSREEEEVLLVDFGGRPGR